MIKLRGLDIQLIAKAYRKTQHRSFTFSRIFLNSKYPSYDLKSDRGTR